MSSETPNLEVLKSKLMIGHYNDTKQLIAKLHSIYNKPEVFFHEGLLAHKIPDNKQEEIIEIENRLLEIRKYYKEKLINDAAKSESQS